MKKIQISSLMGVDNSQYTRIESGKLQPTLNHLVELNSKLGVDLNWLINGRGNMFNESYSESSGMIVANEPTSTYGDFQQKILRLSEELAAVKNDLQKSNTERELLKELLSVYRKLMPEEGNNKKIGSA